MPKRRQLNHFKNSITKNNGELNRQLIINLIETNEGTQRTIPITSEKDFIYVSFVFPQPGLENQKYNFDNVLNTYHDLEEQNQEKPGQSNKLIKEYDSLENAVNDAVYTNEHQDIIMKVLKPLNKINNESIASIHYIKNNFCHSIFNLDYVCPSINIKRGLNTPSPFQSFNSQEESQMNHAY